MYRVANIARAGETVASAGREIFPGGKGLNQSIAAARAGASVQHFGAVGEDGDFLLALLADEGVDTSGVQHLPGPSGHAIIQVDDTGRNAIVISGGSNRTLPATTLTAAIAALDSDSWLLLQNETNHVAEALAQAGTHAQVAINLAPADQRIHDYPYASADLLIVNETEAMALAERSSPTAAFDALRALYPRTSLVLTLGATGLLCFDRDSGEAVQLDSFKVVAVDETAAGDAFVGYLMAGLCAGVPLREALVTASAAGALAVTVAGAATSIPRLAQVRKLCANQELTITNG